MLSNDFIIGGSQEDLGDVQPLLACITCGGCVGCNGCTGCKGNR